MRIGIDDSADMAVARGKRTAFRVERAGISGGAAAELDAATLEAAELASDLTSVLVALQPASVTLDVTAHSPTMATIDIFFIWSVLPRPVVAYR